MQQTVEWLTISKVARLRASSEDESHPVRGVLADGTDAEWRAGAPGAQAITLRFHQPRDVARIRLVIVDPDQERTQELTVSWSSHRGETHRTVIRQQFNFSPSGATTEVEDYEVDLRDASAIEVRIVPDISGKDARARLTELRVA